MRSVGPPRPEPSQICLWTFVTPLPPGWHKVDKKVSGSLVNPRLGKVRWFSIVRLRAIPGTT
eukprot:scaffold47566_cov57-Phaeocystis_antarctica.AAC.2